MANTEIMRHLSNRIERRRNLLQNLYWGLTEINQNIRNRWKCMKATEASWEEDLTYDSDLDELLNKANELKTRAHDLEREQTEDKRALKCAMRVFSKYRWN